MDDPERRARLKEMALEMTEGEEVFAPESEEKNPKLNDLCEALDALSRKKEMANASVAADYWPEKKPLPEPEPRKFWNSYMGMVIRWISFVPLAFLGLSLVSIVVALAEVSASWIFQRELKMTFFVVILAVIAVFVLFNIVLIVAASLAFMLINIPRICCAQVAPDQKIASVILSVLWGIFSVLSIIGILMSGQYWHLITGLLFYGTSLYGCISSYWYQPE